MVFEVVFRLFRSIIFVLAGFLFFGASLLGRLCL